MNKILLGGAAAAALMAGGVALAQTAPPAPAPDPAAHAGRHSHVMRMSTRADVQAHVAKMFAKLDTNHDGFITQDELSASEAQHEQKAEQRAARFDPSKMFDRLDLNHDGQVTMAEAEAAHGQHAQANDAQPTMHHRAGFSHLFARADTNKDGVVTRAEFDAASAQMKAHMQHAGMARGGMAGHMFEMADTNKDGRVSLTEAQAAALAHFDQLDLNHDGTISPDERKQARALFKSQHHKS
ncbi:MAG TPA: EF-hand domain-containing protein [Sphingomicrobium sp.]|nr:EF-hand domain-containing protein [Sphingomicrobium sp.]